MTEEQFSHWYEDLPVLTYGELEELELLTYFNIILQWKKDGVFISDKIPDEQFTMLEYWLLLGLLSPACLDYGTSPRGAWLTPFGEKLLEFLNAGKHLSYIGEDS